MNKTKFVIKELIKNILEKKHLSNTDKKRIVEKILWIEKEINIYSSVNAADISKTSVASELDLIFNKGGKKL